MARFKKCPSTRRRTTRRKKLNQRLQLKERVKILADGPSKRRFFLPFLPSERYLISSITTRGRRKGPKIASFSPNSLQLLQDSKNFTTFSPTLRMGEKAITGRESFIAVSFFLSLFFCPLSQFMA